MSGDQDRDTSPELLSGSPPSSARRFWDSIRWEIVGPALLVLGILSGLFIEISSVEVDLSDKIHKESKEITKQVGENAKAIGKLEGEMSGLKREVSDIKKRVEAIDGKLDRVLETRQGEAPPADPPVKHSQRR